MSLLPMPQDPPPTLLVFCLQDCSLGRGAGPAPVLSCLGSGSCLVEGTASCGQPFWMPVPSSVPLWSVRSFSWAHEVVPWTRSHSLSPQHGPSAQLWTPVALISGPLWVYTSVMTESPQSSASVAARRPGPPPAGRRATPENPQRGLTRVPILSVEFYFWAGWWGLACLLCSFTRRNYILKGKSGSWIVGRGRGTAWRLHRGSSQHSESPLPHRATVGGWSRGDPDGKQVPGRQEQGLWGAQLLSVPFSSPQSGRSLVHRQIEIQ